MSRKKAIVISISILLVTTGGVVLLSAAGLQRLAILLVTAVVALLTLLATLLTFRESRLRIKVEEEREQLKEQIAAVEAAQEREKKEADSRRKRQSDEERREELAQKYLKKLLKTPEMSQVKILEMSVPIDLMSIYVQLRLHQETRPKSIHPSLLLDQDANDPNIILRTSLQEMGHNAGVSYDPDYAIKHFKRSVILGSPGAGKTTLLKYLALKCATARRNRSPGAPIPVHIDLHHFANSGEVDLVQFAVTQWNDIYDFPKAHALPYLVENLQSGDALVLLDALDEALVGENFGQAEESYTRITDAIRKLSVDYPLACIVVTARTAGYQQRTPLMNFTELEILEFSSRDIEEFIRKWFDCYKGAFNKGPYDLIVELRKASAIHALATNPLLLVLIVMIYQRRRGHLPDQRAKLYEECVDLLLERWEQDQKRQLFHDFKKEAKLYLLEDVAWHFHIQRKRYFPISELLAVTAEFLPKIRLGAEKNKKVIDEVSLDTGLLREWAKGWYTFLHLTLQEYFTALAANEKHEAGCIELLRHVGDPWWEEVILLYVSRTRDASPFMEGLLDDRQYVNAATNPLFLPRLILAGRCLTTRPRLDKPGLLEDITKRLLVALRHTPFSLVRQQLAESLAAIDDDKMNTTLIDILMHNDDDLTVQVSVARTLGTYASETVLKELKLIVFNEQVGDEVRVSIAQALAASRMPDIGSQFIEKLQVRWMSHQVRLGIASALAPLIDEDLLGKIIALLREGKLDTDIRCALIDAFSASDVDQEILGEHLYSLCEQEKPGSTLYWHLAIALAVLDRPAELEKLLSWLTTPASNTSGSDLYISFKLDIIKALATLRLPWLVPQFLSILPDERIHWEVRVGVVGALEAIGDNEIVPDLIRLVPQKEKVDSRVRAAIATVIGSLGDDRMVKPLLRLDIRHEKDPRVYRSVVTAIGRLGEGAVVNDLLNWVVKDVDEVAREADFTSNDDYRISVAERLNILDALERLYTPGSLEEKDRGKLFEILISLVEASKEKDSTDGKFQSNKEMDREIQQQVIFMLPSTVREIAEKQRVEDLLLHLLSDQDTRADREMLDDVHQALWMMQRRWPKERDAVKTLIM